MSYQVLARKWRPRSFSTLVGQEHVVKALTNALENQRLHHAYLLTGTRGVGKTTIARILAKSLNCETGITATPCGQCTACQQIDGGRFVDLLEIDAASNTGIDNIREVLENAQYAPTAGRFKVYIIDEVHMLSKNAFNAMLKTLEEPPGHVKFILATTDPQKVPVTILSRCLQFSLRNMTPGRVADHLQQVLVSENIPFEASALPLIGHAAAGSMRDALSLLDQAIAYGAGQVEEAGVRAMLGAVDQTWLYSLLDKLALQDGPGLFAECGQLADRGLSFDQALQELAQALHHIALAQAVPAALDESQAYQQDISRLAAAFSAADVQLYYQIALQARRDLPLAPDEQTGFSMALLRMLAFAPTSISSTATASAPPATRTVPTEPAIATTPSATPPVTNAKTGASALDVLRQRVGAEPVRRNAPPDPKPEAPAEAAPVPTAAATHALSSLNTEPQTPADHMPPPGPAAETISQPGNSAIDFDGNWQELVSQLKLGAAGMLAQNSVLTRFTGNRFELMVPENHRVVTGREFQDKLRHALGQHFGAAVDLLVSIGNLETDTPAIVAHKARQAKQDEAEQIINQDRFVQAIMTEFAGSIIPGTIKPV